MSRQLSRGPFARETLHARRHTGCTVDTPEPGTFGARLYACDWCGTTKRTKRGRPYAYRFTVESDAGRTSEIPGTFCSVSCMRTFHER